MIESVKWSINNSCNLNCPFCFANYKSKVLTLEEDYKVLDKLHELRIAHVDFFGKEPLFNDDIFKIMKYGESKGYNFLYSFITNGVNLEKFMHQLIGSPCRNFSVSYDFLNARSFNVSLKLIEKFPSDFSIEFAIDVHKEGYKELAKKVRDVADMNILNRFYFNPILPTYTTEFFEGISEEEYEDFIELLGEDILDISTVKIPYIFPRLTKKYVNDPRFYTEIFCTAGISHFFIDSDGTAYGCNEACFKGNRKYSCDFLSTDIYTLYRTIYNCGKRECI